MINIDMTTSQHGSAGMPETLRLCVADVRALQGTTASAARTGTKAVLAGADAWGTDVRGYRHVTDVVLNGAFPGIPAWSPPI